MLSKVPPPSASSSQDLITHFLIILTVFLRISSYFSESFIKQKNPALDVEPDKYRIKVQHKSFVILKAYFCGCSLQFYLVSCHCITLILHTELVNSNKPICPMQVFINFVCHEILLTTNCLPQNKIQ